MFQNIPAQKIDAKRAIAFGLTLYCVATSATFAAKSTQPDLSKPNGAKPASISGTSKLNNSKTDATKSSNLKPDASKSCEQLANGERMFKKNYCVGCHSNGGNALMPDRPIKGAAFTAKYKDDGVLEKTIRKGFPEEGMPAFPKDQISENQMKDLILYIRTFSAQNK